MSGSSALPKLVSGGQTGVDRAALDVALDLGLDCGGWCPRGRAAEDGPIASRYPLRETPGAHPSQRTTWNVRDSQATLALVRGEPVGGTALALAHAKILGRPTLLIDLSVRPDPEAIQAWIANQGVQSLNVAGPRESQARGVYRQARSLLEAALGPRRHLPPGQRPA
jgi:hypothetical protein